MYHYSISGTVYKWFSSYLYKRKPAAQTYYYYYYEIVHEVQKADVQTINTQRWA